MDRRRPSGAVIGRAGPAFWTGVLPALAAAIVVRLVVVAADQVPTADATIYLTAGENLLSGDGYTRFGSAQTGLAPPVPVLLAALRRLTGDDTLAFGLHHLVWGTVLVLVVAGLAREVTGDRAGRLGQAGHDQHRHGPHTRVEAEGQGVRRPWAGAAAASSLGTVASPCWAEPDPLAPTRFSPAVRSRKWSSAVGTWSAAAWLNLGARHDRTARGKAARRSRTPGRRLSPLPTGAAGSWPKHPTAAAVQSATCSWRPLWEKCW